MGASRLPLIALCVFIVVALRCSLMSNAQLPESPAETTAQPPGQQPIIRKKEASEDSINLNIDKELFKKLFVKRRKEHLEAVKNLQRMNSYERQYKMINVLAEKMFDVIESKKVLLENFTQSETGKTPFAAFTNNELKDAVSSVLENIALFGEMVLNLPEITHRILKAQPKWNSTMIWSLDFLNRTKDWLDKPTLEMINLVLQELNITKRDPNYINPHRMKSSQSDKTKKKDKKKEKKKREPMLTRVEL